MASQQATSKLVPPLSFACVEEGLFRSAGPRALNLPFVTDLNLDTIIWMAEEDPIPEFLSFVEEKGIKLLRFGIAEITTAWEPDVERSSGGIKREDTGIMYHGQTQNRWSIASTLAEYKRLANNRSRVINEFHIETFNKSSVELPERYGGGYDGGYQTGTYGGGGYPTGSQGGSQASPGKSAARNTLRPVTIKQIIDAQSPHDDSTFIIDGSEVGNVTFIAQIRSVADLETNTTYKFEDGTGSIEVKQFKNNRGSGGGDMDDEEGGGTSTRDEGLELNAYARVTGNIKQFNNKKNIGTQHVTLVTDFNEIQCHFLEATAVHLYFTRGPPESMQAKHTGGGAAGIYQQGGMAGGDTDMGGAGNTAGAGASILPPGISPAARKIYAHLKNRKDSSEGMHISVIATNTGLPVAETYKAVDELLSNGVCFTTMDDEHIACMDF
ncbi:hypothetical protein H072_10501 [Dactylellina haptotyla CBS 200.50]|uniref:Replication protein A C-terminal domain-containing protein n=1 Tax=Dactylellina haptotyla (strain CBS 200.50) TaxID=1284197 RepID=S8A4G2_DACHA|nr:hypothetical protein H072_10501 [Dactylellina haptotyla CBS 200.50]